MKGVMLGICPEAQLVDITHEIPPYEITAAAYTLAQAWRCFPVGSVHLVVVDPGVGSARRAILAGAAGHYFVAPDNGVLTMALGDASGHQVREITEETYFRHPVSRTFHGRDIFAPVAAHLATGVQPAAFGALIHDYARLSFLKPVQTSPSNWAGTVLHVDRFGNIVTNFDWNSFRWIGDTTFGIRAGAASVHRYVTSYADVAPGELCVVQGSAGFLEISANLGSAAAKLGLSPGAAIEIFSHVLL